MCCIYYTDTVPEIGLNPEVTDGRMIIWVRVLVFLIKGLLEPAHSCIHT